MKQKEGWKADARKDGVGLRRMAETVAAANRAVQAAGSDEERVKALREVYLLAFGRGQTAGIAYLATKIKA